MSGKAINSLKALHEATPEELRETNIQRCVPTYMSCCVPHCCESVLRDTGLSLTEYEKRGDVFWRSVYGDTADNIQVMLNSIYPDMGKSGCLVLLVLAILPLARLVL